MLSIRSPTPTTVCYTVCTRPPATTLSARLATAVFVLGRVLAASAVLLVLLFDTGLVLHLPPASVGDKLRALASRPVFNVLLSGNLATAGDDGTGASIWSAARLWRLLVCAGVVWLVSRKRCTEESLLVIRGLGVQTSTSSSSYLWSSSTRFIPTCNIQDIFIHEAFKAFEVRYYLSIVVEGEDAVVVVFPNILPRRQILEEVWRGARACLYEPK